MGGRTEFIVYLSEYVWLAIWEPGGWNMGIFYGLVGTCLNCICEKAFFFVLFFFFSLYSFSTYFLPLLHWKPEIPEYFPFFSSKRANFCPVTYSDGHEHGCVIEGRHISHGQLTFTFTFTYTYTYLQLPTYLVIIYLTH